MKIKVGVVFVLTPCGDVRQQLFGGPCCLRVEDEVNGAWKWSVCACRTGTATEHRVPSGEVGSGKDGALRRAGVGDQGKKLKSRIDIK